MPLFPAILRSCWLVGLGGFLTAFQAHAQIDPMHRNLIEFGYDQPIQGQGPQGIYAYYYYNQPDFLNTNTALRMALAPAYVDSEIGFKQLISPTTDVGMGINGGAFGDNYYEIRQGHFYKEESFDGHDGGASLSVYQLFDPGRLIPLNGVARAGFKYSTFAPNGDTAANFEVPENQVTAYTRVGLRLAGKEPVLYPALGLELSVWFERQWRFDNGRNQYGFADDRQVNPGVDLYWVYAGLNYDFTNIMQKVSFAVTAGDSSDADRLSAWRLGGVLPLVSEFPLEIPGYYYEELTARRFVHLYGAYDIGLDRADRWTFRIEAAAARLGYLVGFSQPEAWQSGAGCGITFTPVSKKFQIVVRYGYGFNAIRDGHEGSQSVGLLFQYNFEAGKKDAAQN